MCKTVFFSIILIFIMSIGKGEIIDIENQNSNQIQEENVQEQIESVINVYEENQEESTIEPQIQKQQEESKQKNIQNDKISNLESKNETKPIQVNQTTNVSKKETKENQKQEQITKTEEIIKSQTEEKTQINTTKEPIYNSKETEKMKNAIDKFAKQNENLIGANGEKMYNIKISKNAMKYNYFSPYRENQIETKVANVFSCTFIIYAVDMPDGSVRYYIGIE